MNVKKKDLPIDPEERDGEASEDKVNGKEWGKLDLSSNIRDLSIQQDVVLCDGVEGAKERNHNTSHT